MTPKEARKIIEKANYIRSSFVELTEVWEGDSNVMDDLYPFNQSFDELTQKVIAWTKNIEENLMSEVTWYDRNKEIIETYLGKEMVHTNSADWGPTTVWILKSWMDGEVYVQQCVLIDNDDDVILTIRLDTSDGTSYNDIVTIRENETQLIGLMQILTRNV